VVESGATARTSLGITEGALSPNAQGDFVIGETASNPVSVSFPERGSPLINGKITLSAASSILTFELKGLNGSDPSASNPVFVRMAQGSNALNGGYAIRKVTAALSATISSGSTLGHSNAVASAIYFYAIDDAATIKLGAASKFFGEHSVGDSTAEGGAGGADSRSTLYATSNLTSVAITCLLRWQSTQTAAGTWASTTGIRQLAPFPFKAPTVQVFTGTGANTYTKPWDALWAKTYVQAAGGGGGGSDSNAQPDDAGGGGGGGGGGYAFDLLSADAIAPTETATVGAGGTAGAAANGTTGGTGGTSSFGSLSTATGGAGGIGTGLASDSTVSAGGAGGVGSSGTVNTEGADGGCGLGIAAVTSTLSYVRVAIGGAGGASHFGGGGTGGTVEAAGTTAAGAAGNVYGGGGGGSATISTASGGAGGAGANGVVIVEEYYV
jgi:hypothetical protein